MCFECNEPCQGTSPRKTAHVITDLLRQNFITASAQTKQEAEEQEQATTQRGTTNPPAFRTARDGGGDWATTREEQTKL